MGVRLAIAAGLILVAVVVAFFLRRRRPSPPTRDAYPVPRQLDRADFPRPETAWLVAYFSSATCDSCQGLGPKVAVLSSREVATYEADYTARRDLHDRYAISAIPMILAHAGIHAHGAGHILRLGPLLPLALVACIAGLSRGLPWRGAVRGAAAIALGAAGLLHLALFPEHLHEGSVAGLFFLASAAAELLVAVLLVSRPGPLVTRSVVGIVVVLLVVYVAARLIQLPFTSGREGVDAIGLVTKAVEIFGAGLAVIGDRPQLPRVPSPTMVSAMALGLVAFASHPLFGEGPALLHAALSIGTATIGAMALGGRSSSRLAVAVTDGAVLALLLRGPWAVTALAAPAVAELLRAAARRAQVRVASPAGLALVLCLVLPQLDGRLEVLHVGHPSETLAALVVFLLAGILGVAVWHRGQLPVVVGFVVAHLGGQALRLLADRTSFEAVASHWSTYIERNL